MSWTDAFKPRDAEERRAFNQMVYDFNYDKAQAAKKAGDNILKGLETVAPTFTPVIRVAAQGFDALTAEFEKVVSTLTHNKLKRSDNEAVDPLFAVYDKARGRYVRHTNATLPSSADRSGANISVVAQAPAQQLARAPLGEARQTIISKDSGVSSI